SGGRSAVSTVCNSLNDIYNAKDWNDDPIKAIATSLSIQIPTTLKLDILRQKRDELQKEKELLEKEQKQQQKKLNFLSIINAYSFEQ
ncbi:unnamed protein product, partial [Didymodactylos carnosus]